MKKEAAVVTILCRNSDLICCCSIFPCECFLPCSARDAYVVSYGLLPRLLPSYPQWPRECFCPRDLNSLVASAAVGGRVICHSLPHFLTLFSMPSAGTAVGRVLAGNGVCGTWGWEGRARRGKGREGKRVLCLRTRWQFLSCLTYNH